MDEADRDLYTEAFKAWEEAEAAYRELNQKHIAVWWEGGGSPPPPAEVLTAQALRNLKDLRQAAAERQDEFEALARSLRGA